jgi:hypothetical protein
MKRCLLVLAILPLGLTGFVNVGARAIPPFVSATASYLSPLVPDLLSEERNVRRVFPHAGCSCPNHTASRWLDLAEGRLRLDRLAATATQNFLPLAGWPTLIIIDEGWLALDDPGFAGQLREWLKTLRKKNASVVFATQSLADIESSAIPSRRSGANHHEAAEC